MEENERLLRDLIQENPGLARRLLLRSAASQEREPITLPRLAALDRNFFGPIEPNFTPFSAREHNYPKDSAYETARRHSVPISRPRIVPPQPRLLYFPTTHPLSFADFFNSIPDDDTTNRTPAKELPHKPKIRQWFWQTNYVYNIYTLNQDFDKWSHQFPYMFDGEFRLQHTSLLTTQSSYSKPVYSDDRVEDYVRTWLQTFTTGWSTFSINDKTLSVAIINLHGFKATHDTLQIINHIPNYLHSKHHSHTKLNLGFIYGPITNDSSQVFFQPTIHKSKLVEIHLCIDHQRNNLPPHFPSRTSQSQINSRLAP
ncbi:hypothetical protein DSO57_1011578 [Entomophthora muscae]|uniref:Uncharacterized protein n=1 Tax=Entomophthora muscae TaxID=34485 RepID=A0ACC2TH48_9FUNG|nr:hypothetical protein DSO57_1011578 [Entomophthora muscae]